MPTIRRLLAALVAVVVAVGLVAPADAHPRRADRVTVVVDVQGHMGEGARSAVGMWSGAQDQIRMTLADRCPRRTTSLSSTPCLQGSRPLMTTATRWQMVQLLAAASGMLQPGH